jgi:hypothetical protein
MRAREFINEVKMSPTSLEKMSAKIDARVGFEFEVYVPKERYIDYDNYEPTPDMSYDTRINTIDDIVQFFGNSDNYSTIDSVESELLESYDEWFNNKIDSDFEEKKYEIVKEMVENQYEEIDIIEMSLRKNLIPNHYYSNEQILNIIDAGSGRTNNEKYKKIYKELEDDYEFILERYLETLYDEDGDDAKGSSFVSLAREAFVEQEREDSYDDYQVDFLESIGLNHMSDVYNNYRYKLSWPHEKEMDENDIVYSTLASELQVLFNKTTNWSNEYHSVERGDWYVVEYDGSLEMRPRGYIGAEIITPTPPPYLQDSLEVLKKFYDYAKENNFRTNRSTGLHISISVPNMDQLDPLKLILFMGDRYVLDMFDRKSAKYAMSAFDKLSDTIYSGIPQAKISSMFDSLRKGFASFALDSISLYLQRNVSANITKDRVEFRGPGNDWLNQDINIIIDTVRRFTVALYIACDSEAYKNEYAKKLYSMVSKSTDQTSVVDLFAKYSSGLLPQSAFKSLLKMGYTSSLKGVDAGTYYIEVSSRHYEDVLNWEEINTFKNKQIPTIKELKILRNTVLFRNSTRTFWSSDVDPKTKNPLVFNMYSGKITAVDPKQEYPTMFVDRYPKK